MPKLRTFKINLQTTLFIDNKTDVVYAAHNLHNKVLVWNTPLITNFVNRIIRTIISEHNNIFPVDVEGKTDCFNVTFWANDKDSSFNDLVK